MPFEPVEKLDTITESEPANDLAVMLDSNEAFYDLNKEIPGISDRIAAELGNIAFNRYPDTDSIQLEKALADYYETSPDYITAGNGSDEIINLVEGALFQKGDIILTLSPDFSMYAFYGNVCELKTVTLQKDDNFTIDISRVISYCNNNNVKGVIFSNPCNPTSVGVSRDDIARLLKNVFCLVIIDEAYMDFWTESAVPLVKEYDNLVVIKSLSASPGIAALRMGCAIACEDITAALRKAKPSNISALTSAAVCAVLDEKEKIGGFIERVIESRDYLAMHLREFVKTSTFIDKVYESSANFIYVKTAYAQLIHDKLEEVSVSVRALKGFLRITAGTREQDDLIITTIENAAHELEKGGEL